MAKLHLEIQFQRANDGTLYFFYYSFMAVPLTLNSLLYSCIFMMDLLPLGHKLRLIIYSIFAGKEMQTRLKNALDSILDLICVNC